MPTPAIAIRAYFMIDLPLDHTRVEKNNARVRRMFQRCRERKQFRAKNLPRAATRRGVSCSDESPARVCGGKGSCLPGGVSGTLGGWIYERGLRSGKHGGEVIIPDRLIKEAAFASPPQRASPRLS